MNYFGKLCVIICLSLSGLAASEAVSETVFRRFNCVVEHNGSISCHEGHDTPCVCFFDMKATEETALKIALLEKLKAMGIVESSISEAALELYGIGKDGSIHNGWDKITPEQKELFWVGAAEEGYANGTKDLGSISMAAGKLAQYVIKVKYSTTD